MRLSERSYIRLVAAIHFITGGIENEVLYIATVVAGVLEAGQTLIGEFITE